MGHPDVISPADEEGSAWLIPRGEDRSWIVCPCTVTQTCSWRLSVATISWGPRDASTHKASFGSSSVAN